MEMEGTDSDPTVTSGHAGHLLELRNSTKSGNAYPESSASKPCTELPPNVCSRTVEILHTSIVSSKVQRATVSSADSASDTRSASGRSNGLDNDCERDGDCNEHAEDTPPAPSSGLSGIRQAATYADEAPLTLIAREYCLDTSPVHADGLHSNGYGSTCNEGADPSSVIVHRYSHGLPSRDVQDYRIAQEERSFENDCGTSVNMTGSLLRQSVPSGARSARPISYTNSDRRPERVWDSRQVGQLRISPTTPPPSCHIRTPSPRLDGKSIEVLNERMDTIVLDAQQQQVPPQSRQSQRSGQNNQHQHEGVHVRKSVPYSVDGQTSESVIDNDESVDNDDSADGVTPLATDKFGFFADGSEMQLEPTLSSNVNNTLTRSMRAAAPVPLETLRKREQKWLYMLEHWPTFMDKHYLKLRSRCRKGIPSALRGRAWKYLCGAHFHMTSPASKHVFDLLDSHPGDANTNEEIRKDISRQFPDHELFSRRGPYQHGTLGQEELYRLLKAYTILQPDEGYCQGQAPVAAALLMHMPLRDAFYCFVQLCHKYLNGYYSAGLEAVQIDGRILHKLLKSKCPPAHKHLKKQSIDGSLYMVEWFMCLYCRTLPWPTVLRIWDMFFCEGIKVIFKVAVVLFRFMLGNKEQVKSCPDLYTTLDHLKNLPIDLTREDFLIPKVNELQLDEEDLERLHYKEWKKWQKEQSARKAKR